MSKIILLTIIALAYGEAPSPYPPSGWRPEGQPFTLPSRQIQAQYGAPDRNINTPSTQYLPDLGSADDFARNNFAPNYLTPNNQQQPNSRYSPNFEPTNTASQNNFASMRNSPNAGVNNQFRPDYQSPNNHQQPNFEPANTSPNNNFASSSSASSKSTPSSGFNDQFRPDYQFSNNQQRDLNNFASASTGSLRNSPNNQVLRGNLRVQPQSSGGPRRNFNQVENFNQPSARKSTEESAEDEAEIFETNLQNAEQNDFGERYSTPGREYGASATTGRSTKNASRKPSRTTPKPATTDTDEETELGQRNAAVSSAGASTGQYYILQPDGTLQRVVYNTAPSSEGNRDSFIANLMYETIEPIKGPIFSYNDSPLLRLNN